MSDQTGQEIADPRTSETAANPDTGRRRGGKRQAPEAGSHAMAAEGPATAVQAAPAPKKTAPRRSQESKAEIVLKRLRSSKGATLAALSEATGWQAHSVRGFLSGTIRKRMGLPLVSETGKDGVRRYRLTVPAVGG